MSLILGILKLKKRTEHADKIENKVNNLVFRHRGKSLFIKLNGFCGTIITSDTEGNHYFAIKSPKDELAIIAVALIYNQEELAQNITKELNKSITDTKGVIINGFLLWRERFFDKIVGDFSFIVYDNKNNQLLSARSPIGLMPLYYYKDASSLIFSNRIETLIDLGPKPLTLNNKRIIDYLMSNYNLDEKETFFTEIKRVVPGHYITADENSFMEKRFWFVPEVNQTLKSEHECRDNLLHLLRKSVNTSIQNTNKSIIQISGGLDSQSISALAIELFGKDKFHFVSLTYEGYGSDEKELVEKFRNKYGIGVEYLPVAKIDWKDAEKIEAGEPWIESPFEFFTGISPSSKFMDTEIIISGAGGDEVLHEYGYFPELLNRKEFLKIINEVAPIIFSRDYGWKDHLKQIGKSLLPHSLLYIYRKHLKKERFPDYLNNSLLKLWQERCEISIKKSLNLPKTVAEHRWNLLNSYVVFWGMELLEKRAALRGKEFRFPFFNRELVEFALSIPSKFYTLKYGNKYLLRKAMKNYLPSEVLGTRKTSMFKSRINYHIRTHHKEALLLLSEKRWETAPYIKRNVLMDMFYSSNPNDIKPDQYRKWSIIYKGVYLEKWLRHLIDSGII